MPPYYLVSTALEPDDCAAFAQRAMAALLLLVPGVAPLHGIVPLDAPMIANWPGRGGRQIPAPSLIGMIEACPSGVRSHEWTLPMLARTAARCALRVAYSLAVAHGLGFAIGGIRPEHIIISGSPERPEVAGIVPRAERFWQMLPRPDFGIMPAYLDTYDAPEQLALRYDGKVTPASDIFSLCATLAFWLTGRHPFAGDTPGDQISAIRNGRRAPIPAGNGHTPQWLPPLMALVEHGLATDPAARPRITDVIMMLKELAPDVRPAWEGDVP
jgi:serine/threonine protein kinase